MALLKSTTKNIPEGVIMLSEQEALTHQMEVIKGWKKTTEVFALRFGPYILGTSALLNGVFFNSFFRRKFILGNYGRIASYLPICFVPGAIAMLMHTELVLRDVLLMNTDQCPLCLQSRAAALQVGFGSVFPLVLAPIGCSSLALKYSTYYVPPFHKEPKAVFNIFKGMFTKIKTKSLYLIIAQAFLASTITYFEASNLYNITEKLRIQEKMQENS